MTPAKRARPSWEDFGPTNGSRLPEAHADLVGLLARQRGDVSWKLTDDNGQHSGSDFGTLASLIDDPSSVQELQLTWDDGEAGATSLPVLEELKAFSRLRSLSLHLETEDDSDVAEALAGSLSGMPHLERLSLGGFVSEQAFSPSTTALPAGLRELRLHHSAPEAHACLVERLFTTPLPHLERLHLQCDQDLRDQRSLKLWARLAEALHKWIPVAHSLCELSYPAEVRWAFAAYQLRCTLAKSPSLHALTFSRDFRDQRVPDADNHLALVSSQLGKNLSRLLDHPYKFFDPVCDAFMGHVLKTGDLAPNDIARHVQAYVMGGNTPRDRRRAMALLFVCKAFCKVVDGREAVVRLLRGQADARPVIAQQYGIVADGAVRRLHNKLMKV
jgi:hypothetical protein